jgi:peptidoglycan hydrolase CwlO-like protein
MTKKERKELANFIDRYKEIETSIDLMQKSIESLAEKRDDLFEELDQMKGKEKKFMDKLIEKYGESNVTPWKLKQIYEEGL